MSKQELIGMYFVLWFITFPLTIFIVYTVITELLDLIINTGRIDNLLKYSDQIDISNYEVTHHAQRETQSKLSNSNLLEVERQVQFTRISQNRWSLRRRDPENERIRTAKEVTDIFKVND